MEKKMEKTLHETYSYLVSNPNRAELIEAVDELILAYGRNPKLFVMPNVYKWATPLLEEFAYDLEGWVQFVREVVEAFPKRGEDRRPAQLVYRKLHQRHDAVIRRDRLRKGLAAYVKAHGEFEDKAERDWYAAKLHDYWKLGRLIVLANLKRDASNGISPQELRTEACDDYWAKVRAELESGKPMTIEALKKAHKERADLYALLTGKTK